MNLSKIICVFAVVALCVVVVGCNGKKDDPKKDKAFTADEAKTVLENLKAYDKDFGATLEAAKLLEGKTADIFVVYKTGVKKEADKTKAIKALKDCVKAAALTGDEKAKYDEFKCKDGVIYVEKKKEEKEKEGDNQ